MQLHLQRKIRIREFSASTRRFAHSVSNIQEFAVNLKRFSRVLWGFRYEGGVKHLMFRETIMHRHGARKSKKCERVAHTHAKLTRA